MCMEPDKDKISNSDLKKIEDLLKQAQNQKVNLRKNKKKLSLSEKQRLALSINSKLNEHIDSYILLGFDVNGNDVIIVNSTNEMESRALRNLLEDFLMPFGANEHENLDDHDQEDSEL